MSSWISNNLVALEAGERECSRGGSVWGTKKKKSYQEDDLVLVTSSRLVTEVE